MTIAAFTYTDWFNSKLNQVGPWEWNETGVDAVVLSPEEHEEIIINQMVDFFATIEAPYLKEGNVDKLYRAGFGSTESIIMASPGELIEIIGENGNKISNGLEEKLTNIPLHKLMGATSFFGRGVGVRKFKKLLQTFSHEKMLALHTITFEEIVDVDGFEEKTAEKILNGMDRFLDWLAHLEGEYITIDYNISTSTDGAMKDQKVVFTGFREKSLAAEVEAQGGTMQSGVSGKTTILVAANPNSNSGKMKKARESGVRIMGIEEFKELLV